MSNDLVVQGFDKAAIAKLQEILGTPDDNSDLTDGLSMGFPIVSIKGKVFRVKEGGEERIMLNAEGDPAQSITAVVLKSSPYVGKIYYAKAYAEGDDDNPDCFSVDGFRPDASVAEPQNSACANCPMNAFGSRISENGSKVKACSDSRRLAILPYPDLTNDDKGPLMLRVPTMSMRNLAKLKNDFKQLGAPYRAAILKIGFDSDKAYPALTFKIMKAVTPEEAMQVAEWLDSVELEAIFNETIEHQPDAAAPADTDQERVDRALLAAEKAAGDTTDKTVVTDSRNIDDELAQARAEVKRQKELAAAKKADAEALAKAKAAKAAEAAEAAEAAAAEAAAEPVEEDDDEAELAAAMAKIKARKAKEAKAKAAAEKKATPKQEALDEGDATTDEDEDDLDSLLADALGS